MGTHLIWTPLDLYIQRARVCEQRKPHKSNKSALFIGNKIHAKIMFVILNASCFELA